MRLRWIAVLMVSITLGALTLGVQSAEIHDVIKSGDMDRLVELLRSDDSATLIGARARGGSTPLHWAAVHNVPDAARLLIDKKAKIDAVTDNGSTPLHWAANRDSLLIARLLVEHGADVNAASSKQYTPLHWAAIGNAPRVAAFLIESGADINAAGSDGITPLHWATRKDALDVVRTLLDAGADIQIEASDGTTPAYWIRSTAARVLFEKRVRPPAPEPPSARIHNLNPRPPRFPPVRPATT